jgi:hypothetical protein
MPKARDFYAVEYLLIAGLSVVWGGAVCLAFLTTEGEWEIRLPR